MMMSVVVWLLVFCVIYFVCVCERELYDGRYNIQQAKDRANPSIGNKGMEAAETAMEMVERFHALVK